MLQFKRIWYIALKDLRLFFTDRTALIFFVLFPFLFITLFTLMNLGGVSDPRFEVFLTTREADDGLSHQIINAMVTTDESQLAPGEPAFIRLQNYDEAFRMVEDDELSGFLAFPADFTSALITGKSTQLEIVAGSEDINTRAFLGGIADAISSRIGSSLVVIGSVMELTQRYGDAAPADTEQLVGQIISGQDGAAPTEPLIQFRTEKVGEVEAENASNWAVPGYLTMFVFFAAAMSAVAIVRERQNNTLERLVAGSLTRNTILAGIFAGTSVKGITQIIIFWTFGILVFNTELGPAPAAVILLSVLVVIASSAFGVMLATLVSTQRAADSISVLASLIMAPLGGCWWPLFILPRWMQNLAKITPHGWAVTGFNKLMLYGADFSDVVPEMLALIVFAAVFGIIAAWRFRTSSV